MTKLSHSFRYSTAKNARVQVLIGALIQVLDYKHKITNSFEKQLSQ